MKTVLFANRAGAELAPLTNYSCVALLSVACKPLIVHAVESLAMANLTDVLVVVSSGDDAVEAALGDGARWGMRFEYVPASATESTGSTVARLRERLGDEYLLVRGEVLRTPIIAEFLDRCRFIEARSVVATIGGVDSGVRRVRREARLDGRDPSKGNSIRRLDNRKEEDRVEFSEGRLSLLESLTAFHRACLDIVAGEFAGLIVPGREVAPRVKVGRHSKLPMSAIKDTPLLVGSRCSIASNAELGAEVLVSNDVVIDRRAVVRSSVIMPNSYIGELVEVANAIVAGDYLIHVDTGTIATVTDSFLLARIGSADFGGRIRGFADRLLGTALLCASVWLWPIALVASLGANPKGPVRSRLLAGNRKRGSERITFKAFEFATAIPCLRYLPYLLAVVSGDLGIIGVKPLEVSEIAKDRKESKLLREEARFGLFETALWTASNDGPEPKRKLLEGSYVSNRSIVRNLKSGFQSVAALGKGRSWRSGKAPVTAKDGDTVSATQGRSRRTGGEEPNPNHASWEHSAREPDARRHRGLGTSRFRKKLMVNDPPSCEIR